MPDRAWDETLFAGSARFYAQGRVAYPPAVAESLAAALELDGTGRLLDVGCGPGSLTLQLAPHYAEAVGVDPDAGMLEEAARHAATLGVRNAGWRRRRGEELPAGIPCVRTVVFAQSFHWMDRGRVAATVRAMLEPGGALVHVHATAHRGDEADPPEPHTSAPRPPYDAVGSLVRRYLGPVRRAGRGVLPSGETPGGEDAVYRAAGFTGPERIEVPPWVVERSVDDVVASVYSLSSSAPHLFGDQLRDFDADLRQLLTAASLGRPFVERMAPVVLDIWH